MTAGRTGSGKDAFEKAMAGVRPLKGADRVAEGAGGRLARQASGASTAHSAMSGAASDDEPRITEGSVAGLNRRHADRLVRGRVRTEAALDLHGCTRREARSRVAAFVRDSAARGLKCVLVITGKGRQGPLGPETGALRQGLEGWLNRPGTRERVAAFVPARQRHGGAGAFYVALRRGGTR